MTVHVVTADQAAARDTAAIDAGMPSIQLMRSAGIAAAQQIIARLSPVAGRRVLVCCGPGNNGGDGWIVAGALAEAGMLVTVLEAGEPRTGDAAAARRDAIAHVSLGTLDAPVDVVIDALLGTGARGPLRGTVGDAARVIARARAHGALVVALDLPTGLDATTGTSADGAVRADLTVTFGTVKRAHLVARSQCGEIVAVDIGLGTHAFLDDGAPRLIDHAWVRERTPVIGAEAHKGTRRRLLIVGGDRGMAGAVALAARGAMRAGIGMVRACVHPASVAPLQGAVPEATAMDWPEAPPSSLLDWPHVLLIGPGLGDRGSAQARTAAWLSAWSGPVVLDADALNAFAGDESALGDLLDGRPAIITPHPLEFARLIGVDVDTVLEERFEIGARLARALHAVVLLKGVPSVITAPDGTSVVSAAGTPVLGSAGSGDILAGVAATLLAQGGDPFAAAACAAWIHGRAGELANTGRTVRGVVLDDVLVSLGEAWAPSPVPLPPVLCHLPRVGDA